MKLPQWFRELFAPLNLAAYVTWLAVLAGAYAGAADGPDTALLDAQGWVLVIMLGFLAAFVARNRTDRERRPKSGWLMLGLQALAALGLTLISRNGSSPVLLVIVIAQMAGLASPRVVLILAVLLNLVLYAEMRLAWHMDSPLIWLLMYGGFQGFAALTTLYAHRAEVARAELAQVNADLLATRSLLAESARDAERLKLARELHDVAGHKLTALKLNLGALMRDARYADHEGVALAARLADELLGDIRGVVRQMRAHDGLDLRAALEQLAAPMPSLRVHFDVAAQARVESVAQAEAIVRAVQEALTNAARHAHASNVWIGLRRDGERVLIDIRDDGRGAAAPEFGNGLSGMRERIEALGGELALAPPPSGGFGLHAWLPLKESA